MSTEDFAGNACRQRFKGVENFLRRVAFNLGNTPSQTEVKIISCIPIDVTDLQQKILHLEKQLDEAKGGSSAPPPPQSKPSKPSKLSFPKRTAVNTALYDSSFPGVSCAGISCKSLDCDRSTSPVCLHSKKKSNVSFIFPAMDVTDGPQAASNDNSQGTLHCIEAKAYNVETYEHKAPKMNDPQTIDNRRKFFKKKKRLLKSRKTRSPCVYYAQTNNSSPFNKSDYVEEPKVCKNNNDLMTRSYLAKMIDKQYKPKLLGDNLSTMSQFSSPVCRDTQPQCEDVRRYESDVCSCCHGPFHNIDDHMMKYNTQTYMINEMNTGSAYYDTNHYDLVPVREKPVKIRKDIEIPRKKEPNPRIDMKCWPENVRTKYPYHSSYHPHMINYQTAPPRTEYIIKDRLHNYLRQMPVRPYRIDPIGQKVPRRRRESNKVNRPLDIETSKSCSVDFGTVYPKKVHRNPKLQKNLQPIPILRKNAECLTTIINNSECQTAMSNLEANLSDAKTEATLNQIKSILQSVLAEVKVSSQTRSQISDEKPKKDAIVQKGPSQSNMQTSSLMNSITYSPYTMSPNPYMASCSRQLQGNQLYYPHSPLKCFQNFPLFIQPPGRHVCSCYRNSSHTKSGCMKQATTIATNTDELKDSAHSKETEKLIKEIYKSMALTMEMPNKDTSMSDYEQILKSVQDFASPIITKAEPKRQQKKLRNVVQAVSELFMKKDNILETSDTHNTTFESKLLSNNPSTPSQLITTDTEMRIRKQRFDKYMQMGNTQSTMVEEEEPPPFREPKILTANTISESESSSSETDSDTTIVMKKEVHEPKQKKEKQGLFQKMFKSVKLFKPKEPKEKTRKNDTKTESEDTSSDSDDYQTIYSQKIEKTVKHRNRSHNLPKRKTHSKISYKQTYQRDKSPEKRKTPYMEQEYRRHWNEKLMFQNNKIKHSSELYSDETTLPRSAYYRKYEARSALVQPKVTPIPKLEPRTPRLTRQDKTEPKLTDKGLAWLKKHKMGIHCGDQWKKLILEG